MSRLLCVTVAVGLSHCALALLAVLGIGALAGMMELQLAGAQPMSWLWVGLGMALLVTGLRRRRRERAGDESGGRIAGVMAWLWFLGFVVGPCEWLWPLAFPALQAHGVGGLLLVTAVYAAATVTAMVAAVAVGMAATARWRPTAGGAQAALGALLMVSGGVVLVGL